MGTFTIQDPAGKSYTIEGENAEGALSALKKHLGTDANPIGDDRAATVAGLRGIPLVGAYVDKGAAMLNAAAQPLTETGLSHADNYADRVAENEKTIKSATDRYESDHPIETGIGKTVVGAGALAPLGATALGARAMGMAGEALLPSIAKGAASFGLLNAGDAALRGESVGKGLVTGAIGGAAGPVLGKAIEYGAKGVNALASPIVSNYKAWKDPIAFAESQVGRGIHESGQTGDQIAQGVAQAAGEGQSQFTVADQMGNAGQRLLSTVTRAPGEGRTLAVNTLDARQAGQSRRVANTLAEGFDSPQTAAQTERQLTAARDTAADRDYGAVRNDAQPVDVSNVLNHIDEQVAPFGVPHDRIAPDGITGRMLAYRRMLGGGETNLDGSVSGGLNDFNAAQMVRHDLSDEVRKATVAGEGNKARLLGGILRQLDTSLENSSTGFRQANANFSRASRDIDSVQTGRDAAMRGRTEDTIPAFQALPSTGQSAFRAGYVDPLIADAQKSRFGQNAVQSLSSPAFLDEAAAMAPRGQVVNGRVIPGMNVDVAGPRMQRKIGREQTMFETRNAAMGGSKTVDNANDHAAMGVDPHLVGQIISMNWHGALKTAIAAGQNVATGNTPAVRKAVADIILQRGANVSPSALNAMVDKTVKQIQFVQAMTGKIGRGMGNGLLIAGPSHRQQAN